MLLAECLDLDIHTCGQVELHQRVDSLLRWFKNIQQPLVCTNLELLPRLFVHVRRTQHTVLVLHRGQRNRPRDLRARALRGLDDLTRGLIQDAVVVSLQPNTNSFFSNHFELSLTPPGCPGRKNYVARAHSPAKPSELPLLSTAEGGCPHVCLRHNLADRTCAYRVSAFADRET